MKPPPADPDKNPGLRKKAKKILSGRKTGEPKLMGGDLKRLLHELEVHQIELELQNEDLTQTHSDLETALAKYTNLYEFAPVGYITVSRRGTIQEANLVAIRYFGVERSVLRNKRFGQYVTSESLQIFNSFLEQLAIGNGKKSCELALVGINNEPNWVQIEGTCFEGRDISRLTLTDINERKKAERTIQQRVKELELLYESGLALSQLLDTKEIAAKIIDLLEHRMNWHHVMIRLFNAEKGELKIISTRNNDGAGASATAYREEELNDTVSKPGESMSEMVFLTPKTVRTGDLLNDPNYKSDFFGMQSGIYAPMRAGNKVIGILSVESRRSNAFSEEDERLVSTLASQAAITFENARLFQASKKEIVEGKKVEALLSEEKDLLTHLVEVRTADLLRINAELQDALRTKDEFLASMSHELRTPLNSVLGLSESLQLNTYGELNEKQIKVLETIEESGKHLLRLINDILDLSKINAGKFEISLEPFSLEEICQSSLNLTKGMSDKKKQRVSFSFPTKPIMIHADARRLKQAFVNLLSNAIKFTAVGGELGLDVQLNEIERQVIITVWDKGIGIKPEEMPKLFKAFTQIDAKLSRQYEGTGLGLSLVKEIVELHHGNIHVISTNNEGSKFYITLPVIDTNINTSENG